MNRVYEKFYIYVKSSFGSSEKKELFDYIWTQWGRRISFYISQVVPAGHPYFDDLYQDVMLKIYEHLATFNPLHSFKAWVYTIARRHCLDFLKSKEERCQGERREVPVGLAGDGGDPEAVLIRDELFGRIEAFLLALSPPDREICYLRFYEDLRYREIGQVVCMKAVSVRSRISQIKAKLKGELAA